MGLHHKTEQITSVNAAYLERGKLEVERLGRGYCWFDTGTHESLLAASEFIHAVQTRQALRIECLEEIAFNSGWIGATEIERTATQMRNNEYGRYLLDLLEGGPHTQHEFHAVSIGIQERPSIDP